MYITAEHLREQVIKPTLEYLGEWSSEAERELLAAALRKTEGGMFSRRERGLGLFQITSNQHRDLWDRYLAFRPDIASRVRGLASQRAFLSNPDSELQTNLSYCTAIAWLLYQQARVHSDWQDTSTLGAVAGSAVAAHA
ncbi:hypothetical protein [Congregibacter litoralis]|uniref:Transglycosylase SLT domain protein n=1 Tax=Congregibacter litoralis KT71 TaxID=314285 RepID=A4A808_9GAMM|nr:hypothetical protein [Congregibacter litoralis]EAQ97803.1 hypothetical protein KT71_14574 [Congregibacter litoralis KT71]